MLYMKVFIAICQKCNVFVMSPLENRVGIFHTQSKKIIPTKYACCLTL